MNENLELEVLRRTASLDKSNQDLIGEIAKHKEAEEAKNRSDQLFRSIAENSADLIAVVDKTGHRIYNKPAYERLLGYTQEELKRTISFQQIHPDDRPLVTRAAQQALKTGVGQIVEYRMQRKDGTYVTLESHGSFIRDSRGEIEANVISARDISDRRMAMQNEKLSAIGQLAAGIAHEINTPVQYVSDNIAFLRILWLRTAPPASYANVGGCGIQNGNASSNHTSSANRRKRTAVLSLISLLLINAQGELAGRMAPHFCDRRLHFGRHFFKGRHGTAIAGRQEDGRRGYGEGHVG